LREPPVRPGGMTARHKSAAAFRDPLTSIAGFDGARVGGLVSTTYGDLYIGPDSRLDGGILVHRRGVVGLSFGDEFKLGIPMGSKEPLRVVIGPRATVAGVLRFKREVKLLVCEGATIGRVVGATPIMFATEQLPLQQSDE